jgi:hypothetical protein
VKARPAVVTSGPVRVTPRRPSVNAAARLCVHCAGVIEEPARRCPSCHKQSFVSLCEHRAPEPAYRISRDGEVFAVTVGDTTVCLGRFRDTLSLRAEDGTRLQLQRVKAIQPGAEVIERMTMLGSCYRCRVAFFLPDFEIGARGAPRVLRVPIALQTRQYMAPFPEPANMAAAYLALGTQPRDDDDR